MIRLAVAEFAYYVLRGDDDASARVLLRATTTGGHTRYESYRDGEGWGEAPGFARVDLFRNGQDYDMIDEAEAQRIVRAIEAHAGRHS